MKQLHLLMFLVLLKSATAQNWCPPGASWVYKLHSNLLAIDCLVGYQYTGDTLMNGKTCKIINGTAAGKMSGWYHPYTYTVDPGFAKHITYEEDRVLFIYNNAGGFDTLVNYDAKIGDRWLSPSSCPSRFTYEVTDTSSSSINGFRLKRITAVTKVKFFYREDSSEVTSSFMEKIENHTHLNIFLPVYCLDTNALYEFPSVSLQCYRDDVFGVYQLSAEPCVWDVGIHETPGVTVGVYPNPFTSELQIKSAPGSRISLLDLYGRALLVSDADVGGRLVLKTAGLPGGVYVLEAAGPGMARYHVKAVKR